MMKKALSLAILLLVIFILHARIEIVSESPDNLIFQFNIGDYSFLETHGYIYISVPGMDSGNDVGAPLLPQTTYYIGIPENGNISYQIIDRKQTEHRLAKPILPVPEVVRTETVNDISYTIDETKYRMRSGVLLQQEEPTFFRFNAVVPLTINPVEYYYEQNRLIITESLTVSVSISGNTAQRNNQIDNLDLSFNIINYDTAKVWQLRNDVTINHAPFYNSDFWYSFEIAENGMYELTSQQLSFLPLNDIDPRTIRIFSTGGTLLPNTINNIGYPFYEIPILVIGEENGQFDTNDRIILYAQKRDGFEQNEFLSSLINHYYNPFSARTVYWLTFGGNFPDPPARMPLQNYSQTTVTRATSPEIFHHESENVREKQVDFTWFTSLFTGNTDTNHNYNFATPNVDPSQEQRLTITLQGAEAVTRSFSMNINGNIIINRQNWSGTLYRTFQGSGFFLQDGNNNAVLTIHRTVSSAVYFDYFTILYHKFLTKGNTQLLFNINTTDYQQRVQYNLRGNTQTLRAFQIINFNQVSQLPVQVLPAGSNYDFTLAGQGFEGTKYAVVRDGEYFSISNFKEVMTDDLTTQNYPIDAIIITPSVFKSYADQLAQLYSSKEGIVARVVDQQDIFNQFNSGMPDPNAIRLYIRYAFYNYPVINGVRTLNHVTLLGSGTVDWRNFSGQAGEKNKIMIFQRSIRSSEDFYVDQSGNDRPDLGIGRIPVQNTTHADIVIGKINNYWSNPAPGLWKNTLLFVADDEYKNQVTTEDAHSEHIQTFSEAMSPGVYVDKIFGFEYPFDPFGNKPLARDQIVNNLNDGRLLWLYVGHGAYYMLGDESYFREADIQLLNNREKLPLFIAASCDVAQYQFSAFNSLSESLVLHPNGGSIASLAANDLTSPDPNEVIMYNFLVRLINNYDYPGIALMQAKTNLQHRYYTYLGDPVLPIRTPLRSQNMIIQNEPDSLFAYQPVSLTGSYTSQQFNGLVEILAYSSEYDKHYSGQENQVDIPYTKWGNLYYRGQSNVVNGEYESAFLIPGDILRGDRGRILAYYFDQNTKKDFVDYYYPKILSNIPYANAVTDTIPPEVTVWLDTPNFRDGDLVSPNPTLYARISDESGINILGELGHKIIILLDNQSTPIDVTAGFIYDVGSYQAGTLTWKLNDLAEGEHNLQLIVFDNYNNPAVTRVRFYIRSVDRVVIDNLLPYPNPISNSGHFTFTLSGDAQITINIYTITGRRIRTITAQGMQGFNQIFWDGRDQEGARLANNTYLYRVRARDSISGNTTEDLGKVIILR